MADLRKLPIREHAIQQFIRRAENVYPSQTNLPAALEKILKSAKKSTTNLGHYKRRIEKYGDTEFFTTKCGWRIVVEFNSEDFSREIATIERIKREENKERRANGKNQY